MKLSKQFVAYEAQEGLILVSTGESKFSGLVRTNSTAAFVIGCLREEISEEELVDRMANKYDAPREKIAADLAKLLDSLRGIGAIEK